MQKIENNYLKFFVISLIALAIYLEVVILLFSDKSYQKDLIRLRGIRTLGLPINEEKPKEENLRFLFFGDLMLDRNVKKVIEEKGLEYIFQDLEKENFFENYDLISANLEGAITDSGEHYSPVKTYDFAFDPKTVEKLKNYNFTFFNLANNHFYDQGKTGEEQTRKNLERAGFFYSGCAGEISSDCASKIIDISDKKIGLIGFNALSEVFEIEKAKIEISQAKTYADFVVMNIHWGDEYKDLFGNGQKKIAYDLVNAGADLMIGHHPHVAQGVEIYKNTPIFYSLGNFIFDQYFSKETQEGYAVEIDLKNGKLKATIRPFKSSKSKLGLMKEKESENFFERLIKNSSFKNLDAGGFELEKF